MNLSPVFALAVVSLLDPATLQTPEGATRIGAKSDGSMHLLSFEMTAKFPAAPAVDHYSTIFAKLGWTRCRSFTSGWEAISLPGPDGFLIDQVMRTSWRSPDGRAYGVLSVTVEHAHDAPRPIGLQVSEVVLLAIMRIAEIVGTDDFVFASRCEEGPLSGFFSESDRYPNRQVPRR